MKITRFEAEMSFSKGSLSKSINNSTSISSDRITAILEKYPELNSEWLFRGNGEMLKKENNYVEKKTLENGLEHNDNVLKEYVKDLKKMIDGLQEDKEDLKKELIKTKDKLEGIEVELKTVNDFINERNERPDFTKYRDKSA